MWAAWRLVPCKFQINSLIHVQCITVRERADLNQQLYHLQQKVTVMQRVSEDTRVTVAQLLLSVREVDERRTRCDARVGTLAEEIQWLSHTNRLLADRAVDERLKQSAQLTREKASQRSDGCQITVTTTHVAPNRSRRRGKYRRERQVRPVSDFKCAILNMNGGRSERKWVEQNVQSQI